MTQKELADVLNTTQRSISHYERGREADYAFLIKTAEFFDVSLDYLLGKSDDPRSADDISAETLNEVLDSELERAAFRDLRKLSPKDKEAVYGVIRYFLTSDKDERDEAPTRLV